MAQHDTHLLRELILRISRARRTHGPLHGTHGRFRSAVTSSGEPGIHV